MLDILVPAYFYIVVFLGLSVLLSYFFFHLILTNKVIEQLDKEGYTELSGKLQHAITVSGKLPMKTAPGKKAFYNTWKEFRKLKISPERQKLYRLNLFYKIIYLSLIIFPIIMLLPIIIFIIVNVVKHG